MKPKCTYIEWFMFFIECKRIVKVHKMVSLRSFVKILQLSGL